MNRDKHKPLTYYLAADYYRYLIKTGFKIWFGDYRVIGGETFLWVTVRPD
ncbi:MAG TPA: hypothetical protein P5294_02060 [Smithellaceae bacterium]|nr:hypothetical protein [Smithellaceae bacterium]HRS88543.1 hypothetical protein [Smithellaceae bacterium]HRV25297.1 hypothetical protein [Smithellaceae bacterium]